MKRIFALLFLPLFALTPNAAATKPNVIVVMTDDQGYGEISRHGNPILKTPNLDRMHSQSVRFTDFHVAPMCTPTRGQLLTGIDAVRNGAVNVSSGRTLLRREFPTMANFFKNSGYRTGLFGKWHLGDNYPFRPQDRGFEETLWFPSSHINSVPDFWDNDYFDDIYRRNGKNTRHKGYTTDVFFGEAIDWIKQRAKMDEPFFCYIPTAAPHWPHFVPDEFRGPIREAFDRVKDELPKLNPQKQEALISFLAMIANIDANFGKLDDALEAVGIRENTIVIYLTDNGSTMGADYFNAGMRGKKTTLWEGGHRVPCFVRWPNGDLRQPGDVSGLTQVQDLLPTLVDLCKLDASASKGFDGISLAPILRDAKANAPADRALVINYSRMPFRVNRPPTGPTGSTIRREGAGVLWKRWRLLEDKALYNLEKDPMQRRNVIAQHPKIVKRMRGVLDEWWARNKARANELERVVIGSDQENPLMLTACEWADVFVDQQRQIRRADLKDGIFHLEAAKAGEYEFELRRWPRESGLALTEAVPEKRVTDGTFVAGKALQIASARFTLGKQTPQVKHAGDKAQSISFTAKLAKGPTTLRATFLDDNEDDITGAYYIYVNRLE